MARTSTMARGPKKIPVTPKIWIPIKIAASIKNGLRPSPFPRSFASKNSRTNNVIR